MNRDLWPFFEQELRFIREQAKEFRSEYPVEGGRLGFDPGGLSSDPHVERMIQSFALLAARVRLKIDDDFPELTDALLTLLQPHALAPLPSMLIAQFVPRVGADLTAGYTIKRGQQFETTQLDGVRLNGVRCEYRTVYETKLWPIGITETIMKGPPFLDLQDILDPADLEHADPKSQLTMTFEVLSVKTFAEIGLGRNDPKRKRPQALRLHLASEGTITPALYEILTNQVTEVVFHSPGTRKSVRIPAERAIRAVGFQFQTEDPDDDESVLPYPRQTFPGYRLLSEYFAYREKFWFIDLFGWNDALDEGVLAGRKVNVHFLLNVKTPPERNKAVKSDTFALGCVPMVNLFKRNSTESVVVTQRQTEYPLTVSSNDRQAYEIYSVDRVFYRSGDEGEVEFTPFYSFRHKRPKKDDPYNRYWFAKRKTSTIAKDYGTEIDIQFCDSRFNPQAPAEDMAMASVTCLNRDLPTILRNNIEQWQFKPGDTPGTIRVLRKPSRTRRPMQKSHEEAGSDDSVRRMQYWRLVSHLALNHLSLADSEKGREALCEYLSLYDVSDSQQNDPDATAEKIRDGVLRVSAERDISFLSTDLATGFVRGMHIQVECDDNAFVESGLMLFASVLERFFALAVSLNSFTRMTISSKQRGVLRAWPPRAGDKPLI